MNRSRFLSLSVVTLLSLFLFVLALFSAGQAAARLPDTLAPLAQTDSPVLTVTIRSSPYAFLDDNPAVDPDDLRVVVIEADVQNIGSETATGVDVFLDYDDALSGWVLLEGESPNRSLGTLEPGAHAYAYWFATYPIPGENGGTATHTYTVTATAANATTVDTSENAYGTAAGLDPGVTIETLSGLQKTGNTIIGETSANVGVGSLFTMSVRHELGNNPARVSLSPAGNPGFDASTLRLVDVAITGTNFAGTLLDQIYIPDAPSGPATIEVTYSFLPRRPGQVVLCPYAVVQTNNAKYDNDYCTTGNRLEIDATLSLSFTATVDRALVQQGERLTYTLTYTNNGELGIDHAWFWSDLDPAVGSVLPGTMIPAGSPIETTGARAAWSIGPISAKDQPGSTGTLTFQVLVDGDGVDVPDGTDLVVNSHFGVEPGDLFPALPAATATLTTTVQAPSLAIAKSDGEVTAEPFAPLTYEVHVTNTGSIPAESVVITDSLPAGVTYGGGADVLVWHDQTPIGPGDSLSLEIPVTVDATVPNGTVLANTATVGYANGTGYHFDQVSAGDNTTVTAPVLSIAKTADTDSVLTARPLTYTLTYTNAGPAPASNVLITDVVPTGSSFVGCSDACLESGGIVTWTVGSVPANTSGSVTFTVLVDTTLATGSSLVNDDYGLVSDQSGFVDGPPVSTTVFRNAAIFDGYAFVDANADGDFDAGELPLPGVAITLPTALNPIGASGSDGYYRFRVEQEGPVTVSAELPDNYFRTTVGTVPANASFGVTRTINFGYAGVTTTTATITGIVFDDANGNGDLDAGELGIPGVTITLDSLSTTTTDALGRYTFATDAGSHTIVEADPAGYVSTTPNSVTVDVEAANSYQVNFGDMVNSASVAVIYGTVFHDLDGNGLQGPGEFGLAAVEITLDGTFTTTTDLNGGYTFATDTGIHSVVETDPDNYISTTPNAVNVQVAAGDSTQVDFGDVANSQFAAIFGTVFDDLDGDGLQDPGELGIAGVEMTLDGSASTTTNANGGYSFAAATGTHTMLETDPAGYISTTPNRVNVDVLVGNSYEVDFGDTLGSTEEAAVILGTVFGDTNANGVQDVGELGLAGVTVILDGTLVATTNAWGGYTFPATVGEVHTVVETDPGGYISTTPNEVFVSVPASATYQVDFGDILATAGRSAIYGTVYEDADRDSSRDAGETGIGGVAVAVGPAEEVTDAYGRYTFPVAEAGDYTVVETDLPGYASSTPNEVTVALTLEASEQVDFGDYPLCEADLYEQDDVIAAAGALTPGSQQARNFCDDAVDWIALEATAGSEYRFTTVASGPRTDTVLTLYSADGQTMLAGNDDAATTTDFSSELVWIAPADGTYLLRVHNRAGLSGFATEYTLALAETVDDTEHLYLPLIRKAPQSTFHRLPPHRARLATSGYGLERSPAAPDGEIVHACPDDYEVDDHWTMARPLVPGAVEVHSFDGDTSLYAADKDFFLIDLAPLATFSVSVTPVPGTGTKLELYDENGNMLDVSGSTALSFAGPAGRYYLGVSPTSPAFGCADEAGYTLEAEFTGNQLYLPYVSKAAP